MDKKALINSRILKFPLNIRTDKIFLVQPKINLQSFKSTPDSLKQHLTALERKRSLGAPGLSPNVDSMPDFPVPVGTETMANTMSRL